MLSTTAYGNPLPFFDTIPDGRAYFDMRVNQANGTLYTHALTGLADDASIWALPDFTITATNGQNRYLDTEYLKDFWSGSLEGTGLAGGEAIDMSADGDVNSGLTFTFNNPINGFGLDLADWATCCFPSGLYISFDGGAPILVGEANEEDDNPGEKAGHGPLTFVGAIDDSATFTTITFYGMGDGDVLYAGGIIRYALVPLGSVSGGGGYVGSVANTPLAGLASAFKASEQPGDLQTVGQYLDTLTPQQASQALKTIFPVNTSVTSQTMSSSSGQTSNTLIEKVGTVLGSSTGGSPMGFAEGTVDTSRWLFGDSSQSGGMPGGQTGDAVMALAASPYKKFNMGEQAVWFQGVGALSDGKSTSATLGYDTTTTGFVSGYEMALDQDHLLGVLASYFYSDIDLEGSAGNTKARNYNLGVYGQKLIDKTKLTAVVSGGYGDYDSERRINVGGVISTPEASYNAWSASATLGASHLFTHDTIKIEPFAQMSYTHVWTDGYQETGGGAFNMAVSDDKFSTVSAKAGVNLQNTYDVGERSLTIDVKPYIGQQWEIEGASANTRLVGTNNSTTINGRDMTVFEVGANVQFTYDVSDNTKLKFGADVSRDKYEDRALGFVGVGFKF